MTDENDDSSDPATIWTGPIGPIPVRAGDEPATEASRKASRIAQAAITCDELVELVQNHRDPLVRMEAVPRLKARFPTSDAARAVLVRALSDVDEAVRCEALSAVADLALPRAGDLLANGLSDPEADVRFFAAIGLQQLDDPRAPADPESFAYGSRKSTTSPSRRSPRRI